MTPETIASPPSAARRDEIFVRQRHLYTHTHTERYFGNLLCHDWYRLSGKHPSFRVLVPGIPPPPRLSLWDTRSVSRSNVRPECHLERRCGRSTQSERLCDTPAGTGSSWNRRMDVRCPLACRQVRWWSCRRWGCHQASASGQSIRSSEGTRKIRSLQRVRTGSALLDWVYVAMNLVRSQLALQRLQDGIESVRWRYTVLDALRVEPRFVSALVARERNSGERPTTTSSSRDCLVAERLDGIDVDAAVTEAELWTRAAERAPKLVVRLVEFIKVGARSCVFVYETYTPVDRDATPTDAQVVRVAAQAFCLVRLCETLGTSVNGRLDRSELSFQGKARGFGPGVLLRREAPAGVLESESAASESIAQQDEKQVVFQLGCLMGDLLAEDTQYYSRRLLRLQASCVREAPEARPTLNIVERKLRRQIQRLVRARSDSGSTEARDEPPSTPEISDVTAPVPSHEDLEEMLHQWESGMSGSQTPGRASKSSRDSESTELASCAAYPAGPSVDSNPLGGRVEAPWAMESCSDPTPNADRVEQLIQLALGRSEQSFGFPHCIRALLLEAFARPDRAVIDTVLKALRRRVLQDALSVFSRLQALYIIHFLLLRGPRSVYDSAITYTDFISLLRSAGQRSTKTALKQVSPRPKGAGFWVQGCTGGSRDATGIVHRYRERDPYGWVVGSAVHAKGDQQAERSANRRQEMLLEQANELSRHYGALILSKLDAVRTWRDQRGANNDDARHQSRRLGMASSLLQISKSAGKLAEELLTNPAPLPFREPVIDELLLDVLCGFATVTSILAPRLSGVERVRLDHEFVVIFRGLARLFGLAIPYYIERSHEAFLRIGRSLWGLSQNCSLDERTIFIQVARRLPAELAIGCGLRAPDTYSALPALALYAFRACSSSKSGNVRSMQVDATLASAVATTADITADDYRAAHCRARSKSICTVPSFETRLGNLPLNPEATPARLGRNLDIDWLNIELIEELGRGSFGTVHKARYLNRLVAVKIFEMGRKYAQGDQYRNFYAEVRTLCSLDHENILPFIGAGRAPDPPRLFIVTEFMPRGTLFDLLHRRREALSPLRKKCIALDICRGMAYLHEHGLLHRDLKSSNLLIDGSYRVKIGDFGLSKSIRYLALDQPMTGNCGTPQYMAPEVLASAPYGTAADVFSFGILLWELLAEQLPYQGLEPMQVITAVLQRDERPPLNPRWDVELVRLLCECWDRDPAKRPPFRALVARLPPVPFPVPALAD